MNNGDSPASSVVIKPSASAIAQSKGLGISADPIVYTGLTKREHFAGLAMQGLFNSLDVHDLKTYADIAKGAVNIAGHLLAELERTK